MLLKWSIIVFLRDLVKRPPIPPPLGRIMPKSNLQNIQAARFSEKAFYLPVIHILLASEICLKNKEMGWIWTGKNDGLGVLILNLKKMWPKVL